MQQERCLIISVFNICLRVSYPQQLYETILLTERHAVTQNSPVPVGDTLSVLALGDLLDSLVAGFGHILGLCNALTLVGIKQNRQHRKDYADIEVLFHQ